MPLFHTDDPTTSATGGDRTFLLVHGWGGDSHTFSAHVEPLRRHGRVITPDLRGHGSSPDGDGPCTVPAMADDLADLLRHGGHRPVVAVGHSMGGQVVASLALRHPDLVHALVVVDPAYGAQEEEMRSAGPRAHLYATGGAEAVAGSIDGAFVPSSPDWLRTAVRRRTLATSGAVLAQAFSSMYLDDDAYGEASRARDVLKHLTCPVLSLCSTEAAAEFCRSVPGVAGSQSVLWAGTSHFLHVEHPGAFVDLVVGWVEDWA